MKLFRTSLSVALVCLAAAFAPAQERSTDKNKENAPEPIAVRLNLLIRDEKGDLVHDLKPEDVRLIEDGVQPKITRFTKHVFTRENVLNVKE